MTHISRPRNDYVVHHPSPAIFRYLDLANGSSWLHRDIYRHNRFSRIEVGKELWIADAADDGEQFIWNLWVQERILPALEGG